MIGVFDDGLLINHSAQPTLVINAGSGDYEVPSVASVQDVVDALLNSHFTLIATRALAQSCLPLLVQYSGFAQISLETGRTVFSP